MTLRSYYYCSSQWKRHVERMRAANPFVTRATLEEGCRIHWPLFGTPGKPEKKKEPIPAGSFIGSELRQGINHPFPLPWGGRKIREFWWWRERRVDSCYGKHSYSQSKRWSRNRFLNDDSIRACIIEAFNHFASEEVEPEAQICDDTYNMGQGSDHLDGEWDEAYFDQEEAAYRKEVVYANRRGILERQWAQEEYLEDVIRLFGPFTYHFEDWHRDQEIIEFVNSPFYDPFFDDEFIYGDSNPNARLHENSSHNPFFDDEFLDGEYDPRFEMETSLRSQVM